MELRRLLEGMGLDVRGFLEGLGVDVAGLEATVGMEIEVLTVALLALLAVGVAGVSARWALRRKPQPAGPSLETPPSAPTRAPPPEAESPPAGAETSEPAPEATPPKPEDLPPPERRPPNDAEAIYKGLSKTRTGFLSKLDALFGRRASFDEELVEELETLLVTSDIGIRTAQRLIADLEENLSKEDRGSVMAIRAQLQRQVTRTLGEKLPSWSLEAKPTVIMVIGVNGVGKTTTIGKLAARFTAEGKKVVLAAGDTFRAAAVEQLEIWGKRAGAEVVKGDEGADPASVIYTAVERARAASADVLLCDTAGRLQTKVNLMNELGKVHRVIGKAMEGAPHEVLMVLDATTGQNAISQAQKFSESVHVQSLALTKLDGTAKGGVVVAIASELGLPVRFVGTGEGINDLSDFDPETFVAALFEESRDPVDASSAHS